METLPEARKPFFVARVLQSAVGVLRLRVYLLTSKEPTNNPHVHRFNFELNLHRLHDERESSEPKAG